MQRSEKVLLKFPDPCLSVAYVVSALLVGSLRRRAQAQRQYRAVFAFLPAATDHVHLQRNDHSCYSLPYLCRVEIH